MDYPSQGFGKAQLSTGQVYRYGFKVQGTGPVKVQFTDDKGKLHTAIGPVLDENAEGTLGVVVGADGNVAWQPQFSGTK